jgi:hypothetical protein
MLTIPEVAEHVRGSERYVRKLLAIQRREDADAKRDKRPPQMIGLRAKVTPRKTLICEADVFAFLYSYRF